MSEKTPGELKKGLGLIHVFCIASGAMISSGLFVLPGLAYAQAGPAVVLSYFLAGVFATAGLLSQAELVSALPKAGGTYFYVMRSMGPAVGTVDGLITWLSLSFKSAFALVGITAFVVLILPADYAPRDDAAFYLCQIVIGSVFCLLFVGVNLVGVKKAGRMQVGLVVGLLVILVAYVAHGLPEVQISRFEPFLRPGETGGMPAVLATAGLVFVSFGGLLKVASVAEEVKNPARVVPLGMLLSVLVVGALYILVVFVTVGTLDAESLSGSLTPIADAAASSFGKVGVVALGIAAILAFVSTANAGIMAASRYPLAASRDGLLPEFFQRTSARFKTPHVAILFTGALMIAALFFKLHILVETASAALILTYLFSCLSVIMMRQSRLQNYQPRFKSPFYPWVQIAGVAGYGFLLFEMGGEALVVSGILVAAGLLTYWFYGRIKANREYALLHLIQRITAKELVTGTLDAELKQIIRERDGIVMDRFDRIIEQCIVLDIDKRMSMKAFFTLVAEKLSERLKMSPPKLLRLLLDRETESSTVLSPGLAIPHIVIDGEKTFDVLLVRARAGIVFAEDEPPVQSAFVLIGTADERNFHLRALSAVAQIVQNPRFEKQWSAARSEQALRDIVLLGQRRRH